MPPIIDSSARMRFLHSPEQRFRQKQAETITNYTSIPTHSFAQPLARPEQEVDIRIKIDSVPKANPRSSSVMNLN